MSETQDLWTFERFEPGQSFGSVEVPLDPERIGGWEAVYGPIPDDTMPDGLIVAGMMEAYILAIQPRPKGNVHAGQTFGFTGARAARGDVVRYDVSVAGKEMRKGRGWVRFRVAAHVGSRALMQGEILSIWAA